MSTDKITVIHYLEDWFTIVALVKGLAGNESQSLIHVIDLRLELCVVFEKLLQNRQTPVHNNVQIHEEAKRNNSSGKDQKNKMIETVQALQLNCLFV